MRGITYHSRKLIKLIRMRENKSFPLSFKAKSNLLLISQNLKIWNTPRKLSIPQIITLSTKSPPIINRSPWKEDSKFKTEGSPFCPTSPKQKKNIMNFTLLNSVTCNHSPTNPDMSYFSIKRTLNSPFAGKITKGRLTLTS